MSHKNKGSSSLPPLDSVRSPREGKRGTSYDYRPDSTSPTTSPRSPDPNRRGRGEGKTSPRNPVKEVSKELRTLCIGSPIPDTDPHADDMVATTGGNHHKPKPKPFRKTPSITIDRVEELNLTKDSKKSPRGGQPLSPVSYDLIEHMPTTPFAKSGGSDRHLMTSPITPPVERKGNRKVINYCRSDGHLPSSVCSDSTDHADDIREDNDATQRWHNRSQTDGNQSEGRKKTRDRRDLTPSPRLTRRARENERSFSPAAQREDPSPSPRRQRQKADEHVRDERGLTSSPPRQQRRRKNTPTKGELEAISPRSDAKKPVRLEPLGKK